MQTDSSDRTFRLVHFALTATVHPKQSFFERNPVCVRGDDRFPLVRDADGNDLGPSFGAQTVQRLARRFAEASPPVFCVLLVAITSDPFKGECGPGAAQFLSLAIEDDAADRRCTGVNRYEERAGIGSGTQVLLFWGREKKASRPARFCQCATELHKGPARASLNKVSEANYLTPAGARRIQEELKQLAGAERPKVVREVAEAAAQGDRSENAEYIYGKKRLREIDRRIRFLTKRLDCAVIVDPKSLGHEEIRFGATVVVRDENEVEKTYTLVGSDESDPGAGRLSYKSPIGRALMKKKEGDVVVVHRPLGEVELEVISITYGDWTEKSENEEISE
jgi:transcription elongation factor GreB